MRRDSVYLRLKDERSLLSRKRLWVVYALLVTVASLSVVLFAYRVGHADGAGLAPPSSARSSVAPQTLEPPTASTGVYQGCQELLPSAALPVSGR